LGVLRIGTRHPVSGAVRESSNAVKNLRASTRLNLALVALVAFTGCGGESEGGSTGVVSTGISASKTLGDVTTAEATDGCGHMKDGIEARYQQPSARTGLCTLLGVTLGSTESACTNLRDSCLKGDTADAGTAENVSVTDIDPAGNFECSGTNIDSWHGCTATVGELETCLNDTLDALDALLNAYTCKDVSTLPADSSVDCSPPPRNAADGNIAIDPATGQPYPDHSAECAASSDGLATPATPASCQALQHKCPTIELFGE
jgi:hypothetical protein